MEDCSKNEPEAESFSEIAVSWDWISSVLIETFKEGVGQSKEKTQYSGSKKRPRGLLGFQAGRQEKTQSPPAGKGKMSVVKQLEGGDMDTEQGCNILSVR